MTSRAADLHAAVVALAQVQAAFVMPDRADGWRHRVVQHRRRLQEQIGAVANAWSELDQEVGATEAGQRFRRGLNQLRARVAEHQAVWPAVAIDDQDSSFLTSRHAMRAASAEFRGAALALFDSLGYPVDKETLK